MSKPGRLPIHEWFSRVAAESADAIAIELETGGITYRELEAWSDAIAIRLQEGGVGRDTTIAIFSQRCPVLVASILGVLKAGHAFVPLTHEMPDGRLQRLLSESTPSSILVDPASYDRALRITDGLEMRPVVLDADAVERGRRPTPVHWQPDDFCYIFFTSGSTGRPKGVAGRMKAVAHFVQWEIDEFALKPSVRVAQLISPAFDAVLRDLFVPLCAGGTICGSPPSVLDAVALVRWIDSAGVQVIHTVPSLLRTWMDVLSSTRQWTSVTHVFVAGEPLRTTDVSRWWELFNGRIALVNLYGPTETTMIKFSYVVQATDAQRRSIPIGKPIPGARALVLSESGAVCPRGVVGEIYIRTPFRSLGYFRNLAATHDVFVPNPFTNDPDDVVYRTGDLGRILEGGDFEFCGRRDRQVKLNGVRIELDEVEAAVALHPDVRQVAVILDSEQHVDRLIAYVVPADEPAFDWHSVRLHVARTLPDSMVPSRCVVLPRLPMTPNGKVDRAALPRVTGDTPAHPLAGPIPTPVQQVLQAIWEELLQIRGVGIEQSFFEVGGHSLLATQLASRIEAALNVVLPLREIFEAPTIAGLAVRVEALRQGDRPEPIEALVPQRDALDAPLSSAQERLWFLEQLAPGSAAYNMPLAVRIDGPLDVEAIRRSCGDVVARHRVLRMRVTASAEQLRQPDGHAPELVVVDMKVCPAGGRRAVELVEAAARRPFALERDPPVRMHLYSVASQEHLLAVTFHHIASDGWSIAVFADELMRGYIARALRQPVSLLPLPVEYRDYARWQRERLESRAFRRHLDYWRMQLEGLEPLELSQHVA